jgi:hypothetical protein
MLTNEYRRKDEVTKPPMCAVEDVEEKQQGYSFEVSTMDHIVPLQSSVLKPDPQDVRMQ